MESEVKHIVYRSPDPAKARYCVYMKLTKINIHFGIIDFEVNDFTDDFTVPFCCPVFAEQVWNSFW